MARRVAATIGAMNSAEDLIAAGARPALSTAVTAAAVAGSTGTVLAVDDGAAVGEADEAEDAVAALATETAGVPAESNGAEEDLEAPLAVEVEMASLGAGDLPPSAETVPVDSPPVEGPGDEAVGFQPERLNPSPDVLNQPRQPNQPSMHQPSPIKRAARVADQVAAEAAPAVEAEAPTSVETAEASQPDDAEEGGGSRSVTVLVHGVPRAAAALALQRHLHGLSQVESVEAREYAEGVLRLHVVTGGRLALEDLKGWDGGAGLEPVTVTGDVLEVRLPGAQGF